MEGLIKNMPNMSYLPCHTYQDTMSVSWSNSLTACEEVGVVGLAF